MKINLFDANFAHDVCSVAGKTPVHVEYVRGEMDWPGITVFTDAYILDPVVDEVSSRYKIGWLHEPECLWPANYAGSVAVLDKFDFIMTTSAHLLMLPGYRFSPYGGVWLPKDRWNHPEKELTVSILYGHKKSTRGHLIRHEIGDRFLNAKWGIEFYGFHGVPMLYGWRTKDTVLSPYRFSIVAETCKQDNLFTEILLDCFACATVPIFWGCPNIGNYFDERGIIPFDTPEDLDSILPELNAGLYESMKPYIMDNLKRVEEYEITEDWQYWNIYRNLI